MFDAPMFFGALVESVAKNKVNQLIEIGWFVLQLSCADDDLICKRVRASPDTLKLLGLLEQRNTTLLSASNVGAPLTNVVHQLKTVLRGTAPALTSASAQASSVSSSSSSSSSSAAIDNSLASLLDAPGGRHDNDLPDYRLISILPTTDELACDRAPYLPQRRPVVTSSAYLSTSSSAVSSSSATHAMATLSASSV
jgi:hypothetical protein